MTSLWHTRLSNNCAVEVAVTDGDGNASGIVSARSTELTDGRTQVDVTVTEFQPGHFLSLRWSAPCLDASALWTPRAEGERWLPVSFSEEYSVSAISGAPAGAWLATDGTNRLTSALSETLRPVVLRFGVAARSAESFGQARIELRDETSYAVSLLLDTRRCELSHTLDAVARWWVQLGDTPLTSPAIGYDAMYSTWYSLGQSVDQASVETQAALAREAGCRAIIVDDGWQTASPIGGYSSCGDWSPDPGKFPDMVQHVARIHDLGMKYLLWFALPFVGENSRAYARFAHQTLCYRADLQTWVLDPRHPDIRHYLISVLVTAVTQWNLDGVKIDFVDAFHVEHLDAPPDGSDFVHVEDAVDEMLAQLTSKLLAVNSEILIEFRQTYVGPRLRRYCNLLRVTDCAMDATENRVHSLDLRMLAERTVIHSDMLMWHPMASAEVAARQILCVLFAVPQISVRLDTLTPDQSRMLAFWLALFDRFRDTLLRGTLLAPAPDLSYPEARADSESCSVLATFQSRLLDVRGALANEVLLVNGSPSNGLILHGSRTEGQFHAEIYDSQGSMCEESTLSIGREPVTLEVPSSGVAILRRQAANRHGD